MSDLERLIRDHAKWADRARHLRKAGAERIAECRHFQGMPDGGPLPQNCIERVFDDMRTMNNESAPYLGFSYEEVWEEAVLSEEVCPACQEVRRLRSERMNAQCRLGAIRAAITRVGRRLQAESEPHQGRGGGDE